MKYLRTPSVEPPAEDGCVPHKFLDENNFLVDLCFVVVIVCCVAIAAWVYI